MYKGQKSIRAGIEDFLCPFTDMYLTCGPNESKFHMGTMAIDVRGKESGIRYSYYSPATVKCIKIYKESGQVMWQILWAMPTFCISMSKKKECREHPAARMRSVQKIS